MIESCYYEFYDTDNHNQAISCVSQVITFNLQCSCIYQLSIYRNIYTMVSICLCTIYILSIYIFCDSVAVIIPIKGIPLKENTFYGNYYSNRISSNKIGIPNKEAGAESLQQNVCRILNKNRNMKIKDKHSKQKWKLLKEM